MYKHKVSVNVRRIEEFSNVKTRLSVFISAKNDCIQKIKNKVPLDSSYFFSNQDRLCVCVDVRCRFVLNHNLKLYNFVFVLTFKKNVKTLYVDLDYQ